jgi:hypothetical protein
MKNLLALMLAMSVCAADAHAARRRVAVTPAADDLAIVFVPVAGQSLMGVVLEVGGIVKGKVTRTVGVRVERRGGAGKGVAALRVWVESPDPRFTIRIDGKPLGAAPMLIDPQAPLGVAVMHRIEIDVPPSAAEGAVLSSIKWEATCND